MLWLCPAWRQGAGGVQGTEGELFRRRGVLREVTFVADPLPQCLAVGGRQVPAGGLRVLWGVGFAG